ncbi:protein CcmA, bactofilin family [Halomicrobium zhouii]|uniref:Protein CcmA, bactofilin family n=1 Tax=Halomicrobium zhouii TaxID=767519 RepID=A0A1I6KB75_9EURY|nr:polymer-forming cytoskeletal protein [Halomicrobium zhouii]SFR88457.1 protein CcmA, bactofilin family [Halomicrobium zhouii]
MTRTALTLIVLVALLASLPAVAAAETRSGGTVVVEEGETVDDDLEAFAGSVVVRGTVAGDLTTAGGDVRIAESGTVEGDVEMSGGSIEIAGNVTGDVEAGGGSVRLADTGRIGGSLQAGAGSIYVDGVVGGDAELGADTITLGPDARIEGNLTYNGDLSRADGATVEGTVTRDESIQTGGGPVPSFAGPVFQVYGALATLLLGAVLLFAFPRFSTEVADRVAGDPVRTGGIGMLVALGVVVGLVLLFVTFIGIPLSLAGLLLFLVVLWAASVYGRYALGEWLLSQAGLDNRWLALVVGVAVVALVGLVPLLGQLVQTVVLVLGFGALVLGIWEGYRNRGEAAPAAATDPI